MTPQERVQKALEKWNKARDRRDKVMLDKRFNYHTEVGASRYSDECMWEWEAAKALERGGVKEILRMVELNMFCRSLKAVKDIARAGHFEGFSSYKKPEQERLIARMLKESPEAVLLGSDVMGDKEIRAYMTLYFEVK